MRRGSAPMPGRLPARRPGLPTRKPARRSLQWFQAECSEQLGIRAFQMEPLLPCRAAPGKGLSAFRPRGRVGGPRSRRSRATPWIPPLGNVAPSSARVQRRVTARAAAPRRRPAHSTRSHNSRWKCRTGRILDGPPREHSRSTFYRKGAPPPAWHPKSCTSSSASLADVHRAPASYTPWRRPYIAISRRERAPRDNRAQEPPLMSRTS